CGHGLLLWTRTSPDGSAPCDPTHEARNEPADLPGAGPAGPGRPGRGRGRIHEGPGPPRPIPAFRVLPNGRESPTHSGEKSVARDLAPSRVARGLAGRRQGGSVSGATVEGRPRRSPRAPIEAIDTGSGILLLASEKDRDRSRTTLAPDQAK